MQLGIFGQEYQTIAPLIEVSDRAIAAGVEVANEVLRRRGNISLENSMDGTQPGQQPVKCRQQLGRIPTHLFWCHRQAASRGVFPLLEQIGQFVFARHGSHLRKGFSVQIVSHTIIGHSLGRITVYREVGRAEATDPRFSAVPSGINVLEEAASRKPVHFFFLLQYHVDRSL
jgi:hypothetical protein